MALVYTPRRLAQAAPSGTTETTVYTVPGGQLAIIKQIMIANVLAGSITVGVSIVPVAGTAGVSNRVVPETTLPGKSVLTFDLSQVMNTGDFISVKSSAGSAATYTVSGVETTVAELPEAGLQVALNDVPKGTQAKLNFHEGANIDLTIDDDVGAGEVDVTIAVSGDLGHVIKDDGTPRPTRSGLNFIGSIVATDDAGGNETEISLALVDADIPGSIARDSEVTAAINALIAAAPGALDTLDELAAALGDDPNFATTVTNALAGKIAAAIIDAKGDILVGTADNTVARKPVGANGTFLKGNSGTSDGLEWAALADGDIPAGIARDSEVTTAVTNHEGAADPHPGYQKESEKGAASGYASLDAGTKVPTAELGGAGADATKFLRGDQTWQVPAGGGGGGETDPLVWLGGW